MSQGSYVNEKRIGKVDDELWSDETVEFIAKGNGVKVKYQNTSDSLDHTKGWPRLVATDRRVFIKVPKLISTKIESVDYEDLSAADLGSSGITGTQIKLRTNAGKTYIFKADEPDDTELRQMVDFIQSKITGEPQSEGEQSSTATPSPSPTDTDQLSKTESCVECGEGVSDGVARCPNCGFDPSDHKTWFWIHVFLTGLLWATLVGIPFSIITILKGRKHRQKYSGGVTG